MRSPNDAPSGEDKPALGWRDSAAVCPGSLQPKCNGLFAARNRFGTRRTVRHATRQFGHVDDEDIVFVTPPNNHFVSRIFHGLEQHILRENFANLLYLVRFLLCAVSLQVDSLCGSFFYIELDLVLTIDI
jgi:hypothetical protein